MIASEDHSIRTRIETYVGATPCTKIDNPQKIIPLEQGLKPNSKHEANFHKDPQKIIPLEQGLKRQK